MVVNHYLGGEDPFVLLSEVEGTMIEGFVVVLVHHLFPLFVQLLSRLAPLQIFLFQSLENYRDRSYGMSGCERVHGRGEGGVG